MQKRTRPSWKGCGTSLITPFDERGRIDFASLEKLADWQIGEGVDLLLTCGAAGETATISGDERKAVTACVVRAAKGRVPVLASTGGNHTAKSVLWARDAAQAGASGLLSVSPEGHPTAEGLFRAYSAIADATDLPILISNFPARTGSDLAVDTILRLAEIPNVVGLKESSLDFRKVARLLASRPDGFLCFAGDDTTVLAMMAMGADGAISDVANEIPAEMSALVAAAAAGDWDQARRLQKTYLALMEANAWESTPGPVKCALALMKRCGETTRLPAVPVSEETRRRIESLLSGLKLLPRKTAAPRREERRAPRTSS